MAHRGPRRSSEDWNLRAPLRRSSAEPPVVDVEVISAIKRTRAAELRPFEHHGRAVRQPPAGGGLELHRKYIVPQRTLRVRRKSFSLSTHLARHGPVDTPGLATSGATRKEPSLLVRPLMKMAVSLSGLALVGLLTACGGNSDNSMSMNEPSASPAESLAAEVAFAQLMIQHHEQAVDMADLALANATSPDIVSLAQQIKSAQEPEINRMQSWLRDWGASEQMNDASGSMEHDMGGMASSGMMTEDQMSALSQTSGREFDSMWLQMMIAHHQGAVTMADQIQRSTSESDVESLANEIVAGQTAEIQRMQKLLTR